MHTLSSLAVITTLAVVGCAEITAPSHSGNVWPPISPPEDPGPAPVSPGFRATVYGVEWSVQTIRVLRDSTGAITITGIGTAAGSPMTLTLRLVGTASGTYLLGADGDGSWLTISGTRTFPDLTYSTLILAGGGTATVLTSSPTRITGRFTGNADSAGGSGELMSFVGEFSVDL